MRTTSLFAEILVIGIQASSWMLLAFLAYLDIKGLSFNVDLISSMSVLIALFALAWSYTIGVVVDRISDIIFGILNRAMLARRNLKPSEFRRMVYKVLHSSSNGTGEVLAYYRTRLRVLRSSIWNIPIICMVGVAYLNILGIEILFPSLLSVIAVALVYVAFFKMSFQYIGLIKGTYESTLQTPTPPQLVSS